MRYVLGIVIDGKDSGEVWEDVAAVLGDGNNLLEHGHSCVFVGGPYEIADAGEYDSLDVGRTILRDRSGAEPVPASRVAATDHSLPSVNPHPGVPDPRLTCWFDGEPAVAIAPRHSGGDMDIAPHWVPICAAHAEHWHDEMPEGERLPFFTLLEGEAGRC